jgi:hypothetical protein
MTGKKLITEIVHKKCPCRCHKQETEETIDHGETPCCFKANQRFEEAPIT